MPTTKICLDNYLPMDSIPKECRFVSCIRTTRKFFQVHFEMNRAISYHPYNQYLSLVGNGETPNAAFLAALDKVNAILAGKAA